MDIGQLQYKPGQRIRKFFFVPHDATWAGMIFSLLF